MFDETVNPYTKPVMDVEVGIDLYVTIIECPFCKGLFGVDFSYLSQVSGTVHCPICCMEVGIDE